MPSNLNIFRENVKKENSKYDYEFCIPSLEEVSNFLRLSPEWIEDQMNLKNIFAIYDDNRKAYFSPKEFFILFLFVRLQKDGNRSRTLWVLLKNFRLKIQLKPWHEIENLYTFLCREEILLISDSNITFAHREVERPQNVYKDFEVFMYEASRYCEYKVNDRIKISGKDFNKVWTASDDLYLSLYPDAERLCL